MPTNISPNQYVAKCYGQQEWQDIYIKFGESCHYIPKVILPTITFPLIFATELTDAFLNGCFDLDSRNAMFREVIKRVVKVAWVSSPLSLQGVLEKVIDTPGGSNAYELEKLQFTWNRQQRQSALEPLISKLKAN